MSGRFEDLGYARWRLRRTPGSAFAALVTPALGIAANPALLSEVNRVLPHPAGVGHPQQVVVMHPRYSRFTLDIRTVSMPIYDVLGPLDPVPEAAPVEQPAGFNILDNGEAAHLRVAAGCAPWLRLFGAQPILGRTVTGEEDQLRLRRSIPCRPRDTSKEFL